MFKKNITKEDYEKLELKYEILLDEYNALLNEVNHLKALRKNINDKDNDEIQTTIVTEDPLYQEVVDYAINSGQISASLIQRKFSIGYNRAARIMDNLEENKIVGKANGSKPREVIINKEN